MYNNSNFNSIDKFWHFIDDNTIQRFNWTLSSPYQESTIQIYIMSIKVQTSKELTPLKSNDCHIVL